MKKEMIKFLRPSPNNVDVGTCQHWVLTAPIFF